jgi:hypothetical protein
VVRLIRAELNGAVETEEEEVCNGNGLEGRPCGPRARRHSASPLPREEPFLRPVVRLATFPSFNVSQVVASVPTPEKAVTTYRFCEELIGRLRSVQECLRVSYPEMAEYEPWTKEAVEAG